MPNKFPKFTRFLEKGVFLKKSTRHLFDKKKTIFNSVKKESTVCMYLMYLRFSLLCNKKKILNNP